MCNLLYLIGYVMRFVWRLFSILLGLLVLEKVKEWKYLKVELLVKIVE